ncbi:MAG TPA: peptidoglycan-binding protein [Blastocatellia bacterium]|nr:peptidoglycan-binding protein [Blastocatellia bacterium]
MRRTRLIDLSVYIIASALILISANVDTSAQRKSRGGRRASPASAKKQASKKDKRGKSDAKKSARGRPGRVKADRGRAAKSGRTRLSRRERRALARSERKGRASYAGRGRSRSEAPLRASRDRDEDGQELSAPQPRVVASGIQSDRVIEIQNALMKAGVYEGPSTGQYDETTSAAMKRFQVSNGLPATGLPSAHTLKKLGVSKRSNDGYAVPVNTSHDKKQE